MAVCKTGLKWRRKIKISDSRTSAENYKNSWLRYDRTFRFYRLVLRTKNVSLRLLIFLEFRHFFYSSPGKKNFRAEDFLPGMFHQPFHQKFFSLPWDNWALLINFVQRDFLCETSQVELFLDGSFAPTSKPSAKPDKFYELRLTFIKLIKTLKTR